MRVLLWKGQAGFVGRMIRLKSGSPYTHAELLFSDGDRFRINSDVHAEFYRPKDAPKWRVEDWDCVELDGGDEAAVRTWCTGEIGTQYDWRGILFCQLFPWGWHHEDRWFCSELCVAALQAGKFAQVEGMKPWYISPAKLGVELQERGGRLILPVG